MHPRPLDALDGLHRAGEFPFQGALVEWVKDTCGWRLEIVSKPPGQQGFAVIPRRWVVERTFGWLGRNRRLAKDYEEYAETTEAWVYLGMIRLMLRRLAP